MQSSLISIFQPGRRKSSAHAVKTPSYGLMSFAAVEEMGSAFSAGHLPQALVGIVWLSPRQEPFLVNHIPQQLQSQTLQAHLFEFLWGWTEDEIWVFINRSLVPQRFPLGSGQRSGDVAGILLFPLRNSTWGFYFLLPAEAVRIFQPWSPFIVNPHNNFPHFIKSLANILENSFIFTD